MCRVVSFLLLVAGLILAAPADGIVIRHDRDDARYRALGEGFPEVCVVGPAMGTLIHPSWVLTAAHVVQHMGPGQTVRCGDQLISIDKVVSHPSFEAFRNEDGNMAIGPEVRDLALVHLARPVTGVEPARLYRESAELAKELRFVGEGKTGDGKQGPVADDRVRRGAWNRVEEVHGHVIIFVFDAPGEHCLELEGISGPGDSGGPAFLEQEGVRYLAGVSSGNDGNPQCRYGSNEYYMRVSAEVPWIEGVLAEVGDGDGATPAKVPAGFTAADPGKPERVPLDSAYARRIWSVADRLTQALVNEDTGAFEALFTPQKLAERKSKGDPLTGLLGFMSKVMAERGSIDGFHPLRDQALMLPDSEYPMVSLVFHLEDGTAGYYGISLDEGDHIDSFSLFVKSDICPQGADCDQTLPLADRLAGK